VTLVLKPEHLEAMKEHGRKTYPDECIGIIGGAADENVKTVGEVRPLENKFPGPRHNRSLISPGDYLKVDREYRQRGLKIVGFYHSHPDHPAKPSDYDRDNALPWASYVIVKVDRAEPVAVTSWVLQEDRGGFDSEEMKVS
jgi:proteasome lid subunit RPN8/RPN11